MRTPEEIAKLTQYILKCVPNHADKARVLQDLIDISGQDRPTLFYCREVIRDWFGNGDAEAVHAVYDKRNKIACIKALRSFRKDNGRDDWGLKECKEWVEEHFEFTGGL